MLTQPAAQPRACAQHSRELEARLLADLLRLSRVTVLYGAPGAGKTTLLRTEILPLLCRRHGERHAPAIDRPRVIIPFPERRRGEGAAAARGEVAIYFGSWGGDPLAQLQTCIFEALPAVARHAGVPSSSLARNLAIWHDELGLRFFIILDGFEQYLRAPEHDERILDFAHELVRVLNDARPVNLLIALREDAQPLLEAFRAGIPGFDEASFHLPALPRELALQTVREEAPAQERKGSAAGRTGTFDRLGTRLAAQPTVVASDPGGLAVPGAQARELYAAERTAPTEVEAAGFASLDEDPQAPAQLPGVVALTHAAGALKASVTDAAPLSADATRAVRSAPLAGAVGRETAARNAAPPDFTVSSTPRESTRPSAARPALKSSGPQGGRARKRLAAVALAAALVLGVWILVEQLSHGPPAQSAAVVTGPVATPAQEVAAAAPPAAAPPVLRASLPQLALVTEPGNSTDAVIAADVARMIGPDAGIELVVQNDGVFWAEDAMPRLALVRYEALEARRRAMTDASARAPDSMRVIAPLYTEEIHFIVRRDSPLQYIHEIRDARINVGPAQGTRGVTAARLYQAMFGRAQPAELRTSFDDDEALRELLDRSIDAMMVVAAQPAKWLLDLPPEAARALRLLKLEPSHPVSQNAIQYYLPAVVLASSYRKWLPEDTSTLATMSFLVTPNDRDPAFVERLETVARSLCRNLPELRRAGHPKWMEVEPTLEVDTGWPYSERMRAAFQSCLPGHAAEATPLRSR